MKRFLSTTAVILTMTSGAAYAEAHMGAIGSVTLEQNDFLASDLIGMRIYNSETEMEQDAMVPTGANQEWDDIGEINDVIVSQDGTVTAVILGVGGFLGIGERDVSVPMDTIRVVRQEDDMANRFLVVNTTKEALEQAPQFDRNMNMEGSETNMAATDNATMSNDSASNMTTDGTATTTTEGTATATTDGTATTASNDNSAIVTTNNENATMANNDATVATENNATMAENGTMGESGLMRPNIARDGYTEANAEAVGQLTAEELEGTYVYGANDETVGEIDNLVMSDSGQVEQVVINVGGFLGLGEKPVAVSFDDLQVLQNNDGSDYRIYIDSTEERLEALPEYEQQ